MSSQRRTASAHGSSSQGRRCGARVPAKVRRVGAELPADAAPLERALVEALENHPAGRTSRAIARAVGETLRAVERAIARLADAGIVCAGVCELAPHRPHGRAPSGRCRLHGGASTGAKTPEGRARLVDAGRRGGLARWGRVRARARDHESARGGDVDPSPCAL